MFQFFFRHNDSQALTSILVENLSDQQAYELQFTDVCANTDKHTYVGYSKLS